MNFNNDNARWDFEKAMESKSAASSFEDVLRDDLTTEQIKTLGLYLFGVNRDFAAAGHYLMELAKPAAEFVVREHRKSNAPSDDGDAEDREYDRRRQEDLDARTP